MEPCAEPGESGEVLKQLRAGNRDKAATAYVQYVLDVRDAFQACNARFAALRSWADSMKREQ